MLLAVIIRGMFGPCLEIKTGSVYFLLDSGGSEDRVKIGRSINVDMRIKQLRTGNPSLQFIGAIDSACHKTLEKELHKIFASKRLSGEFFNINEDTVMWIVNLWKSREKYIEDEKRKAYNFLRIVGSNYISGYIPAKFYSEEIVREIVYFDHLDVIYPSFSDKPNDFIFSEDIKDFVDNYIPKVKYLKSELSNPKFEKRLYDRILLLMKLFNSGLEKKRKIVRLYGTKDGEYKLLLEEYEKFIARVGKDNLHERHIPLLLVIAEIKETPSITEIEGKLKKAFTLLEDATKLLKVQILKEEKKNNFEKDKIDIISMKKTIKEKDFVSMGIDLTEENPLADSESDYKVDPYTGIVFMKPDYTYFQSEEFSFNEPIDPELVAVGYIPEGEKYFKKNIRPVNEFVRRICRFNSFTYSSPRKEKLLKEKELLEEKLAKLNRDLKRLEVVEDVFIQKLHPFDSEKVSNSQ